MTEESGFRILDEDAVLTPVEADRYLKQVNNELGRAQIALRRLRYEELRLTKAYTEAKTVLLFSVDCPKVGRSEGQVTVDERDAWINAHIDCYWQFASLQVQVKNAEDYLRTVGKQVSIAQTLNNNAKDAYNSYQGGGR
ncbi:hypothetical protein AB0395_47920 [Streptosporangium sp. NPDC051023]|uniref:hypothetical protein n=1 Tax=Streptosporangium sp. NPDC051023 TaxID=3155410 RepID=UPI00344CB2EB